MPSPIVIMSLAPNGRFLACFTSSGTLSVISTNFESKVVDFDTSTPKPPSQMSWCGEDSVVLNLDSHLLMVGPYGHWVNHPYDGQALYVIPEADCCRVVTSTRYT